MAFIDVGIELKKKDDGLYAITMMGEEVISFSEVVYKSDGDKIYDALVKVFARGLEIGSACQSPPKF
ncbi:hypothetical protein JEO77_20605 [Aeromonas veronii]|jgi:hypothetical protein|uniref:hypothetical protein n=1 Tax=Aeromonas veronii TaxID=654 RepID=UPI00191D3F94|nr:hypothetical protein [Aeromonas veronii]MBL0443781.1 hypothetical protein [Aeromonas veronii]